MPAFDFPLEKLKSYQGSTPLPTDFDQYWSRALEALDRTPPNEEMIPSKVVNFENADCYDLFFDGVGNARQHAKLLLPTHQQRPSASVLFFHGYRTASPDWFSLMSWIGCGFAVAALDCRGQAGLSEDPGGIKGNTFHGHIVRGLNDHEDKLYYRQQFLDTAQLARIVSKLDSVDGNRIYTCGTSQGGGLALACAALYPQIAKVAAVNPFLCDYCRTWEMDLACGSYEELSTFFRQFDPRHENIEKHWSRLGYISVDNLCPRINASVLLFTGLMDKTCAPSTQFAAYNKLTSPKEHIIYPDFGHVELPDASLITCKFFARP